MNEALRIVNEFYKATDARSIERLGPLLDEKMSFDGPAMQTRGAKQYLEMSAQLLPFHQGTSMLRQFAEGNEVCSIYEMSLRTPQGQVLKLAIADWVRVAKGRIVEQRIYYDPREFAAAFKMG